MDGQEVVGRLNARALLTSTERRLPDNNDNRGAGRSRPAADGRRPATMTTALVRPNILYAWKGPSLFIANTRGDCGDDQTLSGYYFREARFLRTLRLEFDGDRPWLCEAATLEPHVLAFTYVYPEVAEDGGQSGDDIPTNARGLAQRALA